MAGMFAEFRRLVGLLAPRLRHFVPRWSRCRLLLVPSLTLLCFVQVVWVMLAVRDGMGAGGGPDRARRLFDGGIKLDFGSASRMVGPSSQNAVGSYDHHRRKCNQSVCSLDSPSTHTGQPRGRINSDLKANRILSGIVPKEVNVNKLESRTPDNQPWCSGRSAVSSQPDGATSNKEHRYFLTAALLVRIYSYDLAKLTTREMMQWLQYLSYAGVEHVYVYDAYLYKNESQREELRCFIEDGYVTYVDWSRRAKPKWTIAGTQRPAYQDCISKYGRESAWQAAIDIDEYPYSEEDREAGFLARAVREIAQPRPNVGEISMTNYLYLGKPLNSTKHPILIDRLWRRTTKRANALVKPIYQPKAVSSANVHHNSLRSGYTSYTANDKRLRMGHYWGARLQNWGKDTPKVLDMTKEDRGMETAVSALKSCLKECQMGCC